jgi:hypothetical protein
VFVFSIQCVTQRSRLGVLLHFADNTYNFGVFVSVWQTAILLSVGLSEKRKSRMRKRDSPGILGASEPFWTDEVEKT